MSRDLFCSTCGGSVRAIPRPGAVQRLRDWFFFDDRHQGASFECENGHGWTSSTTYSYSSGARRVSVRGVRQAITRHRTVEPVPATYAMAAGVGLVVGLGSRAVFRWRWWPTPLLAVIAAWCAAAATAFTGDNRASTIEALRDRFDPSGAADRRHERRRSELAQLSFPVYGLSKTSEPVSLGGSGGSGGRLDHVTMTYGGPRNDEAPLIDVTTSSRRDPLDYLQYEEERGLRIDVAGPSQLESSDPTVYTIEIEWTETSVTFDGVLRPAVLAVLRGEWSVIVSEVDGGGSVIVRGRNGAARDPLTLQPIEMQESFL